MYIYIHSLLVFIKVFVYRFIYCGNYILIILTRVYYILHYLQYENKLEFGKKIHVL